MAVADAREPVDVLTDESDPVARAKALLELALRAKARDDVDMAVRHLHDAYDLDPSDEVTRETLRSLGKPVPSEGGEKKRSFWRRWFGR